MNLYTQKPELEKQFQLNVMLTFYIMSHDAEHFIPQTKLLETTLWGYDSVAKFGTLLIQ